MMLLARLRLADERCSEAAVHGVSILEIMRPILHIVGRPHRCQFLPPLGRVSGGWPRFRTLARSAAMLICGRVWQHLSSRRRSIRRFSSNENSDRRDFSSVAVC